MLGYFSVSILTTDTYIRSTCECVRKRMCACVQRGARVHTDTHTQTHKQTSFDTNYTHCSPGARVGQSEGGSAQGERAGTGASTESDIVSLSLESSLAIMTHGPHHVA